MTHPFHPLFGCEYELVDYRHFWSEDRVVYVDDRGEARSLPARWTSAAAEDPAVVVSAGRSCFRVVDLLALVKLVREASR
ncbi:hypothetical protein FJZ36_18805 [Candidatus Poribacteria bacterium]|nr:hypothetical protein [Candidatus Poribacteria bacterium]